MAIKLGQSLKQTQQLTMTPQLQQAIKLLTLTHLEMTDVISQEMTENPMLEELGSEHTPGESAPEVDYKVEKLEMQNQEASTEKIDGPEMASMNQDFDWEKYIDSYNSSSSSPPSMVKPDYDEMPNYENMVSQDMSLPEHLEWQLRMENLGEDQWKLAHFIIHNINDDGYLETTSKEIQEMTGALEEDVEDLLRLIQSLDPAGCGTTSLSECLLAQARVMIPRTPLVEQIVMDYLEDLQKKDYQKIADGIGVSREHIKNAEAIILELHPKPGRLISPEEPQYVTPDIFVHEVGGKMVVKINDEGVPRLKISNLYRSLIKSKGNTPEEKDTKEFIQDKLKSALWLIKSIENRQKTIFKVAQAIVKYQPEFFKKGAQFLKPMVLKDIALEIGMHESTVSRVTTNKYMHSPLGTFELKYFFNTGIGGKNGGIDIASESLKIKIKKLITNERKSKPLSDSKISELLKKEGIVVARRTVAKYREILNILPSSKRKQMNT